MKNTTGTIKRGAMACGLALLALAANGCSQADSTRVVQILGVVTNALAGAAQAQGIGQTGNAALNGSVTLGLLPQLPGGTNGIGNGANNGGLLGLNGANGGVQAGGTSTGTLTGGTNAGVNNGPLPAEVQTGPEGSSAPLWVKPGADIANMSPAVRRTYGAIVEAYRAAGAGTPVITSGNDGGHKTGSKHYSNEAVDLRANNLSAGMARRIADILSARLGAGYDVIYETFADSSNNHIHLEYDPK